MEKKGGGEGRIGSPIGALEVKLHLPFQQIMKDRPIDTHSKENGKRE